MCHVAAGHRQSLCAASEARRGQRHSADARIRSGLQRPPAFCEYSVASGCGLLAVMIGFLLLPGVRALGPALGGYMWAVFSTIDAPGHQIIPFVIISACAAATILIYRFVPAV